MNKQEGWQVTSSAAEIYEEIWVPAMLGQWAPQMADAAQISREHKVLDVACGTDIVAREAAMRVVSADQVTGLDILDINEGMLSVARRLQPRINWRQGDATQLPFEDAQFDVVTCQFSLMYFPDRIAALKEMMRVLKPGGRLAIAVWGPLERAKGYVLLTEIARSTAGKEAADLIGGAPFDLGNKDKLAHLLKSAGIHEATIHLREGDLTFPNIKEFIDAEVKGTPLDDLLDEAGYQTLLEEAEDKLQQFYVDSGEVRMPMDAYIVSAEKR